MAHIVNTPAPQIVDTGQQKDASTTLTLGQLSQRVKLTAVEKTNIAAAIKAGAEVNSDLVLACNSVASSMNADPSFSKLDIKPGFLVMVSVCAGIAPAATQSLLSSTAPIDPHHAWRSFLGYILSTMAEVDPSRVKGQDGVAHARVFLASLSPIEQLQAADTFAEIREIWLEYRDSTQESSAFSLRNLCRLARTFASTAELREFIEEIYDYKSSYFDDDFAIEVNRAIYERLDPEDRRQRELLNLFEE